MTWEDAHDQYLADLRKAQYWMAIMANMRGDKKSNGDNLDFTHKHIIPFT